MGVEWVSNGCRKFKVTPVCSPFGLKNSTLAIPLRYPCDRGGVEKLVFNTNAYRLILTFAIPFHFFLFLAQQKNKLSTRCRKSKTKYA